MTSPKHRPNGFPIIMCNGKELLRLHNSTKILFRKFASSFSQRIYSRFRCPSHSGQTCKLSLISHYFGMPPENNYYSEVILNDPTLTVNNPVEGHEIQIIIGSPSKVAKGTLIDFAKKLTEHTRVNQGWSGVHAIVESRELRDLSPLGEPTRTEGDLNAWIL